MIDTSFETWIIRALETSTLDDVKTFLEEAGYRIDVSDFIYETMPPKRTATISRDGFHFQAFGFTVQEALINAYKDVLAFNNLPKEQ